MMPVAPFSLMCVVCVLGTLGNVFILAALCVTRKLRVRANLFILNIAIADIIVTGYIMPSGLVTSQYDVSAARTMMSGGLCDFNAFLVLTTLGLSTQSLMMIAVERYIHICKGFPFYDKIFTKCACAALLVFCWIYTVAWTCQGWTGWTTYIYGENVYVCIFDGQKNISYDICLAVFGIILPMVVISVCYYKIFKKVRKSRENLYAEDNHKERRDPASKALHKKKQQKLHQEHRLNLTLFTIVVLFILFWLPAAIVLSLSAFMDTLPEVLYTISIWAAFSNSCVNSIVYGVMNRNFREGYITLFRILFCCKTSDSKNESPSTSQNNNNIRTKYLSTARASSITSTEASIASSRSTEVSYTTTSSMKFNTNIRMNIPMMETNFQRHGFR